MMILHDDSHSLGLKIDQVVAARIGGIGLWELSYASPSFRTLLEAKLAAPPLPDGGPGGSVSGGDAGFSAADGGGGCSAAVSPSHHVIGGSMVLLVLVLTARRWSRRRRG